MEGLLLILILSVLVIGTLVLAYLEHKRMREEADSRIAMYDNINRKMSDISFSLKNIDFYFHLYHVDKITNKESEVD